MFCLLGMYPIRAENSLASRSTKKPFQCCISVLRAMFVRYCQTSCTTLSINLTYNNGLNHIRGKLPILPGLNPDIPIDCDATLQRTGAVVDCSRLSSGSFDSLCKRPDGLHLLCTRTITEGM